MGGVHSKTELNDFSRYRDKYGQLEQNSTNTKKSSSLRRWRSLTRPSAKKLAQEKRSYSDFALDKISLGGRRRAPVEEDELQVVPVKAPDIPDEEKGTCFVHLHKKDGIGLGVTVSGGSDKGSIPRVSNLRSTGIAARSDVLQVGDFITSVNGIRTSKMKHGEIISLLKNIGEKVILEIEYRLPPTTVKTATILQKTVEVKLKKIDNTFGMVVRGGYHEERQHSRPLVVTYIRPDSPASKQGTIIPGDRISSLNGNAVGNLSCEKLNEELKNIEGECSFIIEYDVSVMEAVSNASGPLLVEISKTPGADLGVTLVVSTHRKKTVICIEKIKQASIADRSGALHIGDQVLSIDGVALNSSAISLVEATKMLSSTSDQVRLEILPVSHLAVEAPKALSPNRYTATISSAQSLSALNSGARRHGTLSMTSTFRSGAGSNRWQKKNYHSRNKYSASATHLYSSLPRIKKAAGTDVHMSLTSMDYLSGNQVVHTESFQVTLLAADDQSPLGTSASSQFGIQLQGGIFATEVLTSPPAIAFIEPDSAADRCGVMQAGDRLISVNGCMCEDSTLDEVNQMLSDAVNVGQVTLDTEFDIAESVVPSSGTFHVKVPKRRGIDLGIIISESGRTQAGEPPLFISEVIRGTVAHRTGTLQEGDRIIAIDGVRLDRQGSSIDTAVALLENAEDVVKLKIRKDDDNSDEESAGSISYSVELKRYGDPLGITISGTEEPFDPITISGLNPGGLAARTGAIHEGDQILSINNISLRAKPLSEAIRLLRAAGETVTLKIKKSSPATPDTTTPRWGRGGYNKHHRVHSATMPRHHVMREAITELSDPEDDVLPPPMAPQFRQAGANHYSPVTMSSAPYTSPTEPEVAPGIAGTHSVDSAMGSWDGEVNKASDLSDSNTLSQSLSPSTSPDIKPQIISPTYQFANRRHKESSGRSIEALRAKFEAGTGLTTASRTSAPPRRRRGRERHSNPSIRTHQVSDWQNALDDLQSVGQAADVVRDLEESIMNTGQLNFNDDSMFTTPSYSRPITKRSLSSARSDEPRYHGSYGDGLQSAPLSLPPHRPQNIQLHKLTIVKDDSEEFGFSLSDGQLERGVFVHSTKQNGPAERATIRPYDRILQINNTRTRDFDCCQAVPLISSSGNKIEVVIARNPCNSGMSLPRSQPPLLAPPINVPSVDNDSLHAL